MSADDIVHGGVCPVCGESFVDGFEDVGEGESIEDVTICVIEKDDDQLVGGPIIHLPDTHGGSADGGGDQV